MSRRLFNRLVDGFATTYLFFRFVGKLSRALTFIFKLLTGDVNFAPRHRMLNGKHHNKINQL
ncbi:hypothetical protein ERR70_03045 [Salmonella enterica]|nr:hypothetical protein [Salmonella enterica]